MQVFKAMMKIMRIFRFPLKSQTLLVSMVVWEQARVTQIKVGVIPKMRKMRMMRIGMKKTRTRKMRKIIDLL